MPVVRETPKNTLLQEGQEGWPRQGCMFWEWELVEAHISTFLHFPPFSCPHDPTAHAVPGVVGPGPQKLLNGPLGRLGAVGPVLQWTLGVAHTQH